MLVELCVFAEFALQKLRGGGAHSYQCNVFLPPGLSLVHLLFKPRCAEPIAVADFGSGVLSVFFLNSNF